MNALLKPRRSWWIAAPLALLAAGAMAAMAPTALIAQPAPDPGEIAPRCVRGFSKDVCRGRLDLTPQSQVFFTGCPSTPGLPGCQTLVGLNTTFSGNVSSGSGSCSNRVDVPCDEFPAVSFFKASFNLTLNSTFTDECRRRGCWDGKFTFASGDPNSVSRAIIQAEGAGTLGVGSHREACQVTPYNTPCNLKGCENCLDVEFIPNSPGSEDGLYRIHLEGMLRGKVVGGIQRGADVCLMIRGDLYAKGTASGGITDPTDGFDFCGNIDGVTITFCD